MGSLRYVPTNLNCADDATKGRQVSIVGEADLSSGHLKPYTPIVMN